MSASAKEAWKELGVHHKTAERLVTLKLTPEKAKELGAEKLMTEYGFSETGAKELLEKISAPKAEVTETPVEKEPAKPAPKKEVAAKEAKPEKEEKPKKGRANPDNDDWVDPKTLPLKERLKLAQKICRDSGHMVNIASEMKDLQYEKVSTGLTALDALLGGGWPKGKFHLVAGRYQSCKSLLELLTIAKCQREDPNALWVWADAENAFDEDWAVKQGVDLDRLLMVRAGIADDMFAEIERLVRDVGVMGVTVDSIGNLLSWQEVMKDRDDKDYTKGIDKDTMALTARFLGKFYRRYTPLVAKHQIVFGLISHLYSTMDQHKPEAIKGGFAPLYGSHVMVLTDRRKGDQDKKQKIRMPDGRVVELFTAYENVFKIEKTRQSATEGHKVAIPFVYGKGLAETDSVIEMAMASGVIQSNGAYYTHPAIVAALAGQNNGWIHGREKLFDFIKSNDQIFGQILEGVGTAMAAEDAAPDEGGSDEQPAE